MPSPFMAHMEIVRQRACGATRGQQAYAETLGHFAVGVAGSRG